MDIQQLLQYTIAKKASDLHLSTGQVPIIRIDGDLHKIPHTDILDDATLHQILKEILPKSYVTQLDTAYDIDLSIEIPKISRFRINVFHQYRGLSAAFRSIPMVVPTLEALGLPNIFQKLCQLRAGLILVTGPTGSGKTTTLASMINHINETKNSHIITIEDPIEYVHESKKSLVQQREVHQHAQGFNEALSAALREDPDYILVGEMRNLETIRLALTAAETGHLVLATLHTNSAPKTIDRIIDVFPGEEKSMVRSMLSESLQAVISQILVRKIGGGRTVAQEIMLCSTAIRNMIRENKIPQIYSAIQTGQLVGMQTLEQSLQNLVEKELIDEIEKKILTTKIVN
ncbi:MAG: type IV pilus twitching motility protein PilT [Gammaproteobacteria bacterium]|nr:type IV pilus twitching motility protein PilT [Gammaproteobacteria bacterium]